jgi:hypothetical protein
LALTVPTHARAQAFRCGNFGVLLAAAAAGSTDAVALLEARGAVQFPAAASG